MTSSAGDDVQLVTFKVGGQDFAFNIFQVERILRYEAPAPLPKAPAFLEGVLQYQGAAVPLIDLRKRLGAAAALRDDTRTVILEFEGGRIGIVVDAVTEVMQVPATTVTPPPGIVKGLSPPCGRSTMRSLASSTAPRGRRSARRRSARSSPTSRGWTACSAS